MKIQALTGFKDVLPEEALLWRFIEERARTVLGRFGFAEIRLPIMEKTELFARSIGEATDIVEKEMYTFADKGETLRPEATAGLLRAFIEHGLHVRQPVQRLFTMGPMFRCERPQKGRLRQFHQMDVEVLGATDPRIDAELMAMGAMLLDELNLNASLEINSLGCPSCRPGFRATLVDFLQGRRDRLCEDCRRRVDANPLRVLDCKNSGCRELVREAPAILNHICPGCHEHFSAVRACLDLLGVAYTVNHFMVRGLDYYCRTTFEFLTDMLGAQAAVGAGGRYDGLVGQLGGIDLPGIGFALGIERLVLLMQQRDKDPRLSAPASDLFVAALGDAAAETACLLVHELRKAGFSAAMDHGSRGLKAQMKQAGRCNARFTLILGDNELATGEAVLRDMEKGEQAGISLAGSPTEWRKRLAARIAAA